MHERNTTVDIQQINVVARSVSQLLSNTRYGLDFYQREYKWAEAQVIDLLADLADRFLDEFEISHDRQDVANYRPYFLGPIVTAPSNGIRNLVDGQQRITTLTLLLICLRRWLENSYPNDFLALSQLIFSFQMGKETFNLDVPERTECLQAILNDEDFDSSDKSESVRNLWDRHHNIFEHFPDDLRGDNEQVLPYFTDWLQHRVTLVEISVPDQDMALEIFETMNDRGLRLNNIDMLKSYLVARAGDDNAIRDLNERWRKRITELTEVESNADAEFVKAWLRSHYADTIRQSKAKASPGDFDIIGTAFHKWVSDKSKKLGLHRKEDYRRFIDHEFFPLSKRYIELVEASQKLQGGLESVRHNAWLGITLQLPVILAAVTPKDDNDTFKQKAALIAGALDIYVVRRMVNYRNFGQSTIVYTMFNLMKELRNQPTEKVKSVLSKWLDDEKERLDGMHQLRLHGRNYSHIRYLLARITSWLDDELATGISFDDYVNWRQKSPFEVEHIWAIHFERYAKEFDSKYDFEQPRNKIGGLLLLPKDFNASFGDMPYEKKFDYYFAQNPLAKSLHPKAYENNPTFTRLCAEHGLDFKSYTSFPKEAINERQKLLHEIAKIIWDPKRFGLDASV